MKTHSDIAHLLNRPVRNEHDYYHKVVYPLLDILGVPEDFRWPQFPIKNPFGSGDLRMDYLVHVQDVPMIIVEANSRTSMGAFSPIFCKSHIPLDATSFFEICSFSQSFALPNIYTSKTALAIAFKSNPARSPA